MEARADGSNFRMWGADDVVYGPVELPTLISWMKEERVTADTWIFSEREDRWHKAAQLPELRMFFQSKSATAPPSSGPGDLTSLGIKPGSLRRVKVFADFAEPQLERFIAFME